jgi:hypothetical protein
MDLSFIALHKHWITADAVSYHLRRSVEGEPDSTLGVSAQSLELATVLSNFAVVSVWYALLYVVIEGYRELSLTDTKLDELLSSEEFVESLRRFRNAVFHYQENPTPPKLLEFLTAPDSEKWINELNLSFKRYFERQLGMTEAR